MNINNPLLQKVMPYCFWCLLALITYFLLMEVKPSKAVFPHFDKLVHAGLFFVLSTVAYWAFKKQFVIAFCGLVAYGALTEGLQHWLTATRHASFLDWIADITGIVLCFLIIRLLKR